MDVHLRELRYFVAVAEHLHFTHAAESLHVSQPALSKQIRSLEADLRVLLFVRHRRTVQLTAAGAALLPHARAVLGAWSQAKQGLAAVAAAEHATLAVGISTGLGRGLLPAVRVRLAESAPLARLQIRQVLWGDPTGGLAADDPGRTDAAFVWLPVPNPQLYEWLEVSIEPRLIALPATHPLAVREDLDITDVLDEPFLALPAESGALRDYWLANDFRDGRPRSSQRRSQAPRRPWRHSPPGWVCALSPPATFHSSPARALPSARSAASPPRGSPSFGGAATSGHSLRTCAELSVRCPPAGHSTGCLLRSRSESTNRSVPDEDERADPAYPRREHERDP